MNTPVMRRKPSSRSLLMSIAATSLAVGSPAIAQDDDEKDDEDKKETPLIEDKTEGFDRSEGLFVFYTDPENGDLYMEIGDEQLDDEFIAFSYSENGVTEAGHFRGNYRDQRIISMDRHFSKIEFIEENTSFYFEPAAAIAKASDANISDAVLASVEIAAITPATDDDGEDRYLIKANSLFQTEALHQVKPSPSPDAKPEDFSLGDLSKDKTRVSEVRNYPENTDIIVDYVFDNKYPKNGGSAAVTDARNITIKVQHSLIAMPDDGFEPRMDDYRVGYFFDQVTDLTSSDAAPYRDLINRWRLEKQDPDAEISDPIEPIVWWIENTTPRKYRGVIRDSVLAWNQSFEKAGFSNAVEVREQPDDATWDAGDIRYNVLRWTSSPNPPFGGYGPSFTNPRTGEIIGADIMLEYVFITNRIVMSDVFDAADLMEAPHLASAHHKNGKHLCSFSRHLQMANGFAVTALQAQGASDEDIEAVVEDGLYYLMLHEVGHTLGLNHNMKASTFHGPREVHDASVTNGAPTASVMDYPAVNIAPQGAEQGDYYMRRPGPYDDWAIEFGYRPSLADPSAEEARVDALLARSTEPGNIFGNDADDMRAPGRGIDPRVMIGDMSTDPVAYAVDRIELVQATLDGLVGRFDDRNSWQSLVRGFTVASGQHAAMARVISRQIGGVYVDRTEPGQSDTAPFTPVPRARQKTAMAALAENVFAPDAFETPSELAARLQQQRRGFNFFGGTEDPKIHTRALTIQGQVLDHVLHPAVLQRMTDSALYGGQYSPTNMILDLNDAVFGNDLQGDPNAFRKNLQVVYTERLTGIIDNADYDPVARSAAIAAVKDIKSRLGWIDIHLSAEAKAHRAHIRRIMTRLETVNAD